MAPNSNSLSPLTTPWNNRSMSSLNSDAATFYSVQAAPHIEMSQSRPITHAYHRTSIDANAVKMSRTDSGYEPDESPARERRSTSTSSRSSRRTSGPRSSNSPATTRPTAKRVPRSSPSTSTAHRSGRLAPQSRYNTQRHSSTQLPAPYTFFQFPALAPESSSLQDASASPHPQNKLPSTAPQNPPPTTISYFLLPETRRLEYAAIDAASRGVRGFVVRIIPDCILPAEFRRRRFHDPEAEGSDCGSVRRYRLCLEGEEKGADRARGRGSGVGSRDGQGGADRGSWWGRLMGLRRRERK